MTLADDGLRHPHPDAWWASEAACAPAVVGALQSPLLAGGTFQREVARDHGFEERLTGYELGVLGLILIVVLLRAILL